MGCKHPELITTVSRIVITPRGSILARDTRPSFKTLALNTSQSFGVGTSSCSSWTLRLRVKRSISLAISVLTTMHASLGKKIQENALYKKLLVATWTAAAHHVDSEHRIKGNINPHVCADFAAIAKQRPHSGDIKRQG